MFRAQWCQPGLPVELPRVFALENIAIYTYAYVSDGALVKTVLGSLRCWQERNRGQCCGRRHRGTGKLPAELFG